ncbi:N-acetylglucosamine kinase [Streptomyces sp. NPDC052396]|uniref:N-acetylglucosamine kinase n=1 Tax=Streptomyces sp. NPDC052396 TaxID=3365689 RepID=UPI0037CF3BD8
MGVTGTLLAIDAGNSKTDMALLDRDGTVLGTVRGLGFRPQTTGTGAALDALARLLAQLPRTAPVDHVQACLANADFPVEEAEFTAEIGRRNWGRTVTVANDTFALLRTGLPDGVPPRGVAVVCGAGINCAGLAPPGRSARFPALGRLSGDWGGGGCLAEEALWSAARADDGRGEPSELARALPAHFGLPDMPALIQALHLGALPPACRYDLVPVLFAVANSGDAVARALIARQAAEIVTMATVALRRLDLLEAEVPVVLGGGILASGQPLLTGRVLELLAEHAPKAVPRLTHAPPLLGAALLSLDHARAPATAYHHLRTHFSSDTP